MRAVVRNLIIVLAVIALAVWSIIPPEKKLRLGKDLRGGVSLVYSVMVRPNDPPDTVPQVISVLKERVDPKGLSEISMVQQGRDRIEVTMPLPNDRVKRLKAEFDAELEKLDQGGISAAEFERVMRAGGPEREAEIDRVASGNAGRAKLLRDAAAASDSVAEARRQLAPMEQELSAARAAGVEAARIAELEAALQARLDAAADAEIAYEKARDAALAATLTGSEVRRALQLSDEGVSLFDDQTKKTVKLESPREQALQRLRRQFPDRVADLERAIAAYERYAAERTHLDDPADLKRLLANAGVLDFRITVNPGEHAQELKLRNELRERGPRNVSAIDVRWFPLDKLEGWYDSAQQLAMLQQDPVGYFQSRYNMVVEPYDGSYFVLLWDTPANRLTHAEGEWRVSAAYESRDQRGFPAIGFEMDPVGASLLGQLTGLHRGRSMAVLLDDRVYTAPTLEDRISNRGIIRGTFSPQELQYVTRVLGAGALQAKLAPEPLSESVLGPDLGLDNLRKGFKAGSISFVLIGAFMVFYYFSAGAIAVFALAINGLLLLGMMSLNRAAFTMPGIAGVILTFGMAVDSNVLIYERMREEIKRGNDLKTAVRLGFSKALSAIVDGNVTNLIVCVVLYYVGTQEIKGFAITMSIGVLTTLFSALVVSRLVFALLVDHGPWRKMSMLPLKVGAIDRFFAQRIDWLRYRHVFWGLSIIYVSIGLFFVAYEGSNMLDNEFRGGTQVTLRLTQDLKRQDVMDRVKQGAESAGDLKDELQTADVLPVNPRSDGVTSDTFTIKTLATNQQAILDALLPQFDGLTQTQPALEFAGSEARNYRDAPVSRIIEGVLGLDIGQPEYRDDIRGYIGGVAVLLEGIEPRPSLAVLQARLAGTRAEEEFSDTLGRTREVRVLKGSESAVESAVVLVRDDSVSSFDNEQRFNVEVAAKEWEIARRALTEATLPASVQNFSAAIAKTFRAQAIVAGVLSFLLIAIYIWVRYGAMNYALGAIVPLVHDVLTAIGMVALADFLFRWGPTESLARSIGLMPFKIDLAMVASFLTIIGYSLNDSIVVMDRIRENRGRLPYASREAVNSAVNQTLSRTVITGGGTLIALIMLYVYGGEGVRGFAYSLFIGVLVGTYSSIGLTAPFVWSRKGDKSHPHGPLGGRSVTSTIPPAPAPVAATPGT